MEKAYTIKANNYNWIKMRGTEVIDICVADILPGHYAGCRCSGSDDTERYDKELGKTICPYKDSCCNEVLELIGNEKIHDQQNVGMIDLIHADIAEENQRLKKQNENMIKHVIEINKKIEEVKKECKKKVDRWEGMYLRAVCKEITKSRKKINV